ncbi:hypothetical protein GIB67_028345 [Kingdonia uniflora]|uniref:non-specific serine/threonine protein kinase n=1 Tax=Kingdonia uniflora TaxID=39325 RepID=A0A7J7MHR7_9MAGN|nr:hypothetical protein GIB67_028345 [Kingdonia uniflora]
MAEDESRTSQLYRVILNRFRDLETSHAKLSEQLKVLVHEKEQEQRIIDKDRNSSWGLLPSFVTLKSPYSAVLQGMGPAVFVCRGASSNGDIIFWNRSAEMLYGWKAYEVVGQRLAELLIEECNWAIIEKIMGKLRTGQLWSGQFPFKKRSGEIFMALTTKSPLYEDGELVGVITVSSAADDFNRINSENLRINQEHANGHQSRESVFDTRRIQWHPQPQTASLPHISSSVSNLVSKFFTRYHGDDDAARTSTRGRGEVVLDTYDVESEMEHKSSFSLNFMKGTTEGNINKEGKPLLKFVQPSKIASKLIEKLRIGASGNDGQEEYTSVPPPSSAYIPGNNSMGSARNLNLLGVVKGEVVLKKSSIHVIEHEHLDEKGLKVQNGIQECCAANRNSLVTSWLECHNCSEIPRIGREQEGIVVSNLANLDENIDAKAIVVPKPLVNQPLGQPSSGESTGDNHSSSSTKGDSNSVSDCEIHWEDLQIGEEIGKGSFAVVYRGIWNGSDVAIKVYFGSEYREATLLDYYKEITIMKSLRHPNVLLFMGAVYSPERLAIVTEFLPRGSLFRTLHRSNQTLDIRRRLRMALDVVGDFGLSKWKNATFLTAKSGRGTPQWMAPEVLRNEPSNEKSDVFSYGVILWELMTVSIPWSDLNPLQVVGIVGFMDRRLDLPENLEPRLSSIIQDCWQRHPDMRPSFQELIQSVTSLLQTFPPSPVRRSSEPLGV